jgi:hypothetical protein
LYIIKPSLDCIKLKNNKKQRLKMKEIINEHDMAEQKKMVKIKERVPKLD